MHIHGISNLKEMDSKIEIKMSGSDCNHLIRKNPIFILISTENKNILIFQNLVSAHF